MAAEKRAIVGGPGGRALERLLVEFASADADDALDGADEYLAVADLAGAGNLDDGVHAGLDHFVEHGHFDAHFGQEVHHVFRAAIQLGVAFLAAKALDFGDGQAGGAHFGQRLAHFVELEGFDDGGYEFHR